MTLEETGHDRQHRARTCLVKTKTATIRIFDPPQATHSRGMSG